MDSKTKKHLDQSLQKLRKRADSWRNVSPEEALSLINHLRSTIFQVAEEWVELGRKAKGLHQQHPAIAEEWVSGPYVTMRYLRFLGKSLKEIKRFGRIRHEKRTKKDPYIVEVVPGDWKDKLLFLGGKAEIRLDKSHPVGTLPAKIGAAWQKPPEPGVCFILGAGNISSIPPMDIFSKVFIEKQTVLLKLNPVMDYLFPVFEKALAPLTEKDILVLVQGDHEIGAYGCDHPDISSIHITGSDKTFETIRYGSGEEGQKNKKARSPKNNKPMTAELGNFSPMIVVPGQWSHKQLCFQAEKVVTSLAYNAGFNCNATRVLMLHKEWSQKDAFLRIIRDIFAGLPTRKAYYPGAEKIHERVLKAHPDASQFCQLIQPGHLPWTMVETLNADNNDDAFFKQEPFCGLFAVHEIAAENSGDYLNKATKAANKLWGTLNCSLVIDAKVQKQLQKEGVFQEALDQLKFGTIAVNCWAATGYAFGTTPWGAYPGHPDHDIQSGKGFVHNAFMLDPIEKCIVSLPFTAWPKPIWFVTQKKPIPLVKALVKFEKNPHVISLVKVLLTGLKTELST